MFITLGALFPLLSTIGKMQNTGPEASRPEYLMYRNANVHAGEYSLDDVSSFCWVRVNVLYDHHTHYLSRVNWTCDTAMQWGEKSPAFTGKESRWGTFAYHGLWNKQPAHTSQEVYKGQRCPRRGIKWEDERYLAQIPDTVGLNEKPIKSFIQCLAYRCLTYQYY